MTVVVLGQLGGFAVVLAAVPLAIVVVLRHRSWRPRGWRGRRRAARRALDAMGQVSSERVRAPRVLGRAAEPATERIP